MSPHTTSVRRPTSRPRRRWAVLLAVPALAGLGLAVAGCGDPTVGDVEDKLGEEIPKEASSQLPNVQFNGDSVSCPDGQSVKKGEKFDCTIEATENNQQVVYTISVEMTGDNSFTYRLTDVKPAGGGTDTTSTTP